MYQAPNMAFSSPLLTPEHLMATPLYCLLLALRWSHHLGRSLPHLHPCLAMPLWSSQMKQWAISQTCPLSRTFSVHDVNAVLQIQEFSAPTPCYDLSPCQWYLSIFFALSNPSPFQYVLLWLDTLLTSFWLSEHLFYRAVTPHHSFPLLPEGGFLFTYSCLLVCSYLQTGFVILSNSLILVTCVMQDVLL